MIAFVDEYRDCFSVECICRVLNEHAIGGFISSRGYRLIKKRPLSSRALRGEMLLVRIAGISGVRLYGLCNRCSAAPLPKNSTQATTNTEPEN